MVQNHLTSLSLSKRLKELRVPQNAYFSWQVTGKKKPKVVKSGNENTGLWYKNEETEWCSAFLSSELGELLPMNYNVYRDKSSTGTEIWRCHGDTGEVLWDETEVEARGLMLEYLIVNGLVKL